MANDFQEVSLGNGVLEYDGVAVGYLKGDVKYKYNYDIEEFKTGQPLFLAGAVTKELISELTAPLAQISAKNMAMALGGLSITSTSAPIVIAFGGTPAESQARTFSASFGGYGLEALRLDGPNVSSLTVKNAAEDTTYVAGTDYLLLPGLGHIVRLAGGAIASGETVHLAYTYDPGSLDTVNLGLTFTLNQKPLVFTHKRATNGKYVKVTIPLVTANGNFDFTFSESTWIINEVTFKAVFDENTPTYPLGKIEFQK